MLTPSLYARRPQNKKQKTDGSASAPAEQKRTLGLVILRGETVVSIAIEGPPPRKEEDSAPVRGQL
jgi:small nuclear ribonucleoprotein B and B'